jgi:hypothetical protein
MQTKININIAVDVAKALSDKTLLKNIYMMDNSIYGSKGLGTEHLCTLCVPGQTIHWVVYAIDLQTPVAIKDITFFSSTGQAPVPLQPCGNANKTIMPEDNPDLKIWTGILPYMEQGHKYHYRLTLQMGNGVNSIISIDGPALLYPYFMTN